jgi:type IV pilus assembly protein PilQ
VISGSQGSYRIAEGKAGYSGQKISLVFDNADIRKILQLIAEVSELNIIASEEVKGNITLRLQEVPWDQALDLIMDIQDLGMVREGNVARIMPRERIRAMEESKLTARRTKEKLEDLVTEVISISYTALGNIEAPAKELLTDRGKITKDDRNKQIIVTDIPSVIADVKNLVSILDTPERQVMIEARIVEADSSFSRDLGVNWGITRTNEGSPNNSDLRLGLGGAFLLSPPSPGGSGGSGAASSMTFGLLGTDSTILNLRLSALETSGHGKIISTPRVTTLNGEKAKISQGTQIPYTVTSTDGQSNTEFVEAALSLEVTPVINPDGSIILEIKATNSTPGTQFGGDAPSINSKEAVTKVLVRDGETTVLGGIFVEDEDVSETGVPWLNKVPILGHLFKSTSKTSNRSELLVFITPRILQ